MNLLMKELTHKAILKAIFPKEKWKVFIKTN